MNKAKRSKRAHLTTLPGLVASDSPVDAGDSSTVSPMGQEYLPAAWVRSVASVLVAIHLFAIAVSFFGVVESSETHHAILQVLTPYLRATHFGAEDRAVYLADGRPREQPHRVQILRAGTDEQWQTLEPTGFAGLAQSDRYARWVAAMVTFAESEQPGLVATLLLPELETLHATDPARPLVQVRIIRLPTELTTVEEDAQPPPYAAAVTLRGPNLNLVQIKGERFNAMSKSVGESRENSVGVDDP